MLFRSLTLHIPGSQTFIGKEQLNQMKDGSVLINCARGGVVDEEALVAALKSGKLAYAGVDVFAQEPPVYNDILVQPNISLSPHIGASTAEAQERVGVELAERICSFFKH